MLQERVCSEFSGCRLGIILFEEEAAKVVTHGSQVQVATSSLLISFESLVGLSRFVISQAEVVPRLGVGRQKLGRHLKLGDGSGILTFAQQALSLEKSSWASRSTSGKGCESQ
jgi:hypothetical protein